MKVPDTVPHVVISIVFLGFPIAFSINVFACLIQAGRYDSQNVHGLLRAPYIGAF